MAEPMVRRSMPESSDEETMRMDLPRKPRFGDGSRRKRRRVEGAHWGYAQLRSGDCAFETQPSWDTEFRLSTRGSYTSGDRAGQLCVLKWFKQHGVWDSAYYDGHLRGVEKAQEFVRAFNKLRLSDKTIYMNTPSMWMVPTVMASLMQGQCVLVEPMISEIGVPFEKFNSNTGYAAEERDFIHALSHFSYHVSGGSYLLCELQGGRFKDRYILTDPVVLSANREFGAADLGAEGIQNFLHFHKCGRFCRSTWKTRHKTERHFMPQKRTAFMQLDS